MLSVEEQERVTERRDNMIDFMSRRDPNRVGFTSMTIYRRLAYLFSSERRCNYDLHAMLAEGRVRRDGDLWIIVDEKV